jgi:hypothetical protein
MQTGVLSVSGGVIGGGLGIQTWLPYLCTLTKNPVSAYWIQMSAATMTLPIAVITAVGARLLAKLVWRPKRQSHTFGRRVQFAAVLVWRGVYFAVVRAAVQGMSLGGLYSGKDSADESEPLRNNTVWMFSRMVVAVFG